MGSVDRSNRASWRARASAVALVAVIWTGTALAYRAVWPTMGAFVSAIDHCPILFCDFDRYFYRQAQVTLEVKQPVSGYLYSAPFAVALSAFRGVPADRARLMWGTLQIGVTLGIFLAPLWFRRRRGSPGWLELGFYALAFATCTAILHNFKWGQVSGVMALGILLSLVLADRGRSVAAGFALAVAIAIKYYAAPVLVFFVLRRDWRALGACAAGLAAAAAISMAAIGVTETLAFQRSVSEHALAASRDTWVRGDDNSQFLTHVVSRWTGSATRAWVFAGYAICVINVALLWRICRARREDAARWGAFLILASTPFWVDTSWPHYFVYLPALQLILIDAAQASRPRALRVTLTAAALISAAAASTIAMLVVAGAWAPYAAQAYLFVANALLLAGAYLYIGGVLTGAQPHAA